MDTQDHLKHVFTFFFFFSTSCSSFFPIFQAAKIFQVTAFTTKNGSNLKFNTLLQHVFNFELCSKINFLNTIQVIRAQKQCQYALKYVDF